MFRCVLILCSAIILQGVSSHVFPKQLLEVPRNMQSLKDFKRQLSDIDGDCIGQKLFQDYPECLGPAAALGDDPGIKHVGILLCSENC